MKLIKPISMLLILSLVHGCAAVVVAGAATGTAAVKDRRTIGTQIDDNTIEFKANAALSAVEDIDGKARIVVKSVNGNLLVVGQAPTESLRQRAIKLLNGVQGIRHLHDQVHIGNITNITTQTEDTWITTKIKLKLLTTKGINSNNISVLTENSEVYLMGLVTNNEADKAVEVVRNISGVAKVIKVFEIL